MDGVKAPQRIYRTTAALQPQDIREIYDGFNSPIAELHWEKMCVT